MTDFFTRLAEQALGVASGIRPTPTSHFDARSDDGQIDLVQEPRHPRSASSTRRRARPGDGRTDSPLASPVSPDARAKSASPERGHRTPVADGMDAKSAHRERDKDDADRSTQENNSTPEHIWREIVALPLQMLPPGFDPLETVADGHPGVTLPVRPSPRSIMDLYPGAERSGGQDEGGDSVVRVTIGRVDVRAIHDAPQPAPPNGVGGPKLSLESYLEQRRDGLR